MWYRSAAAHAAQLAKSADSAHLNAWIWWRHSLHRTSCACQQNGLKAYHTFDGGDGLQGDNTRVARSIRA